MRRVVVSLSTAVTFAVVAWACSGNGSGTAASPATPTPSAPTVSTLTISGLAPLVGASAQFAAAANMSSGTIQIVTSQSAWQSSDPTVANVTSSGVVTGMGPGAVDIAATYQNVTGTAHVTVASTTPTTFTIKGTV